MIMLARLAALGAPAPRHAEVEDHMIVAIGRDDAIFGAARQVDYRRAGQPLREIGGKGAAQVGAEGYDRRQPLAFEERRQAANGGFDRSEEHTSELQSLMRISYAVFCMKQKKAKLRHK